MRIRRGVSGKVLPCGCLLGIYETYDGEIVATIDACGLGCRSDAHFLHAEVSPADDGSANEVGPAPSINHPRA